MCPRKDNTRKAFTSTKGDFLNFNFQRNISSKPTEENMAVSFKDLGLVNTREMFEKAIEIKPFTIFQNGILVCHHSDFVKITVADKYFEINFRKFSYEGIEIKYI